MTTRESDTVTTENEPLDRIITPPQVTNVALERDGDATLGVTLETEKRTEDAAGQIFTGVLGLVFAQLAFLAGVFYGFTMAVTLAFGAGILLLAISVERYRWLTRLNPV